MSLRIAAGMGLAFVAAILGGCFKATDSSGGTERSVTGSTPAPVGGGNSVLGGAALQGAKEKSRENLRQIVLAMQGYESAFQHLPGAAICDGSGRPLLSWRVELLPYLEQDNLYRQFRLNEPWDGPTNKALLSKRPKVFAPPVGQADDSATFYRVFYGNGAPFDLRQGPALTSITDGTSNTIAVVEAGEAVPWTKPDELSYTPGRLPKLGGLFNGDFHVGMADGSVRLLRATTDPTVIHALITRAGGELVPPGN